ncbi:MAG: EI24 domain-containing protein [Bdellovibrionales bacterium]|nr:EI24 domain-containing protein [Bdellovibrionales bacterium]
MRTPRLFLVCLIPWIIAGALSWYCIQWASAFSVSALSWVLTLLGMSLTGIVATVLQAILGLLSWVVAALLMTWIVAILMIPLADFLSELAERYTDPPLRASSGVNGSFFSRAQWRRMKIDFWKTLFAVLVSVVGLILVHVPVLGVLGPVVLALSLSFQFVSYPQTRREQGIFSSLRFFRQHFGLCLGFGVSLVVAFSIPFLSAFVFPPAVVGGTWLFAVAEAEESQASGR